MNFINITEDGGDFLAINADKIEHVRYRPAEGSEDVSRIEIMFVGNPERAFFDGRVAEQLWSRLTEQAAFSATKKG